jgi:chromosome segregation ATPase
MSTVQKVFVVLVFALAVTFTGLSLQMLSTEQKWKEKFVKKEEEMKEAVDDLTKKLNDAKLNIKDLEKIKMEHEREVKRLDEENEKLKADNQSKAGEISTLRQNEMKLRDQVDTLTAQVKDYRDKLDAKTTEFNKEKKRAEDLVKLYHFKQDELADIIAEYNELNASHKTLKENYRRTEEKLQVSQHLLKVWKKKYNIEQEIIDPGMTKPPIPIEGKVVAVTKEKETGYDKLVMLSVGKQDRVKKGYEFIIYRGDKYICTVVVQKVFDDSSVSSVIPESVNRNERGERMQVKQYDSASTEVF